MDWRYGNRRCGPTADRCTRQLSRPYDFELEAAARFAGQNALRCTRPNTGTSIAARRDGNEDPVMQYADGAGGARRLPPSDQMRVTETLTRRATVTTNYGVAVEQSEVRAEPSGHVAENHADSPEPERGGCRTLRRANAAHTSHNAQIPLHAAAQGASTVSRVSGSRTRAPATSSSPSNSPRTRAPCRDRACTAGRRRR